MPAGRKRKHDRASILRAICKRVSEGELVKDVCADNGVTAGQIREWVADDEQLAALYARAREDQAHAIAEQAIAIAHGVDEAYEARVAQMVEAVHGAVDADKLKVLNALLRDSVQRDRLRVDTMKWMASKIAPRHYGERLQQEISGADGAPIAAVVMLPPLTGSA